MIDLQLRAFWNLGRIESPLYFFQPRREVLSERRTAKTLAHDVGELENTAFAKNGATAGATATSVSHRVGLGAVFPKQPPSVTGLVAWSNL